MDLRDELLPIFFTESEAGLSSMQVCLVGLESRPDDLDLLEELFRQVHTLKGNSASMGFERIAELADVLENLLDRLRQATLVVTSEVMSLLRQSAGALRGLLIAAGAGEDAPARGQQMLVAAIAAMAAGPRLSPSSRAPALPKVETATQRLAAATRERAG